jgi:hypothetical protein
MTDLFSYEPKAPNYRPSDPKTSRDAGRSRTMARDFQHGLTAERLREMLVYNSDTGVFIRRKGIPGFSAGRIAGCLRKDGYREICVDHHTYLSHRLAWLYMTGMWPVDEIDHINGAVDDNRFINLREAAHRENGCNQRKPKNNTSGFKGVHWHKQRQKYQASINVGYRRIYLGLFDDPADGHAAYVEAAKLYHGEFARAA